MMVYDTPKAAHFISSKNGKMLPSHDPTGLISRWLAAKYLMDNGVIDMMLATQDEVDNLLAKFNEGREVTVSLAYDVHLKQPEGKINFFADWSNTND